MNNPIVMRYREDGSEVYAVHCDGSISRPGIGMGPSNQWLFTGLANRHGVPELDLPSTYHMLSITRGVGHPFATKQGKSRLHVMDLDHGTKRMHGQTISSIWLDPDAPADALDRLKFAHLERVQKAQEAWQKAERDRKAKTPLCQFADEIEATLESIDEDLITESEGLELIQSIVDRMRDEA